MSLLSRARANRAPELGGSFVVERIDRLVIHPQQLLGAPGDEPRLYGRRPMRCREQPRLDAIAGGRDEALDLGTRIIGTNDAH